MTSQQVARKVTSGAWRRVNPGVYHLAGSPFTAHARLIAACLATGGTASHQSAAWLWDLLTEPPPRPTISIPRSFRYRASGAVIHRVSAVRPGPVATLHAIPCTALCQTLVDLAAVATGPCLDGAIDRGLTKRLITIDDLLREIRARSGRGRRGVGRLRVALAGRGYIGAPNPSKLESLVLRLLANGGIEPIGVEVEVLAEGGRYRLDITLAERLAMEVDGYAYHFDPEAMTRDHRRRNDLARLGWTVLVFTWLDVTRDPERVLHTVRAALRQIR